MYYRHTFTPSEDVLPAGVCSSTLCWGRILGLTVFAIALLMLAAPGLGAQPVVGSDGLSAEERSTTQGETSQTDPDFPGYRAVVIVDSTARNAVFGMYALSGLTQPGWDLYGRTIDWAIDHKDHAATRIWLATYDGTLNPDNGAEKSGLAAYEYLVDSMGFDLPPKKRTG